MVSAVVGAVVYAVLGRFSSSALLRALEEKGPASLFAYGVGVQPWDVGALQPGMQAELAHERYVAQLVRGLDGALFVVEVQRMSLTLLDVLAQSPAGRAALNSHPGLYRALYDAAMSGRGGKLVTQMAFTTLKTLLNADERDDLSATQREELFTAGALAGVSRANRAYQPEVSGAASELLGALVPFITERHLSALSADERRTVFDALTNLGVLYQEHGLSASAAEAFRLSLLLEPHNAAVQTRMGMEQLKLGLKDQAIATLRKAAKADPHNGETIFHLSAPHATDAPHGLSTRAVALTTATSLCSCVPLCVPGTAIDSALLSDSPLRLRAETALHSAGTAVLHSSQCVVAASRTRPIDATPLTSHRSLRAPRPCRYKTLLTDPVHGRDERAWLEAVGQLRKAVAGLQVAPPLTPTLSVHPTLSPAHHLLCKALERVGRLSDAVDAAADWTMHCPSEAVAYFTHGRLLTRARRPGDAEDALRIAQRLDASRPQTAYQLGLAHYKQGHAQQARHALDDAVRLAGEQDPAVHSALSDSAASAAALSPDSAALVCQLEWLAAKLALQSADVSGALPHVERILRLRPGDHAALALKAEAMQDSGDLAQAYGLFADSIARLRERLVSDHTESQQPKTATASGAALPSGSSAASSSSLPSALSAPSPALLSAHLSRHPHTAAMLNSIGSACRSTRATAPQTAATATTTAATGSQSSQDSDELEATRRAFRSMCDAHEQLFSGAAGSAKRRA